MCRQKHSCSSAINTAQQEGLAGHLACHTLSWFLPNILSCEIQIHLVKLMYTCKILHRVIERTNCDKNIVYYILIYCV